MELWEKGIRKTPLCSCLACGHRLNAGAAPDDSGALPGPNDLTVCLQCGAVMKYAADMTLRGMSDEEMDELTNDADWMNEVARLVKRVHLIKAASN
jgi:hypothetical protein